MKVFGFLPLIAITAGLLSAPVYADDHDKKHDKKHDRDHDRDRGRDHRSGSYYSRPGINVGIGIAPRPYYGPSSTVIVERERPVYYNERRVYVDRSEYSGSSVGARVQRGLARRGYYRGPIDGDIGPGSRAAIRNFQADHGLRPTGYIDARLLDALG
ncbi:MAG: hypothetical protein JWL59_45 [Chthoniobacteraceae bacterium]|nr:hypothetical protein [Chthoniobacteraceae bacterium]